VLEDATGVLGDGLHAGGIGGVGSLDAAVVSAGGFVDVTVKMIEEAAEEQAAKASVKLTFPLVFFIFPAVLIVLAGPAAIGLFRSALFQE